MGVIVSVSRIKMERYRKLKVIGKGSFGYAVLVQSVADRQTYVMKIIDVSKMDRKQREDAINEVRMNTSDVKCDIVGPRAESYAPPVHYYL